MTPDNIINKNLAASQMTEEEILKAERKKELDELEPISFEELEKVVKGWMLVADIGIIKLLAAIIVANKLKGHDPVWILLIGPSGGGKTEFLNCLLDLEEIYPISLLTPNTFLSGMPGPKDVSLLPQISNKIMMFKDWTNILSQNYDARGEIFAQLREIYDGHMKKPFGNGKVAEWKGKVGLIAGVTPAVDIQQQNYATLGERFVNYRIVMPDRIEVAWRAIINGSKQDEMRKALKNAYYAFMKGVSIPEKEPEISKEIQTEIIAVANFATMARSGVIRESSFKKEVIFVPAAEMPTRSVQVFSLLAISHIIVNKGKYQKEDMNTIYRLALDSIPQTNYMVLKETARGDEQTTKDIATALGYPTNTIRMYLENLSLLGVCRRIKAEDSEEGGTADRWTLLPQFVEIVRRYEKITIIEETKKEQQEQLLDEALAAKELSDLEEVKEIEEKGLF